MATAISAPQVVTISGGQPQPLQFTCPPDQLVNPTAALIFNKSSYELNILNHLIPAWAIWPLDLRALLGGATILPVNPILIPGGVATGSTVYVQWFDGSEELPDPFSFTADAVAAALTSSQIVTLRDFTVAAGQHASPSINVPSFVQGLTLYVIGNPGCNCNVAITGNITNYLYWGQNYTVNSSTVDFPPVYRTMDPIKDTSITLNLDNSPGTGTLSVHLVGSALPPPVITSETDYVSPLLFSVIATTGTDLVLLQPPSSFGDGLAWEVTSLECHAPTTVLSLSAVAQIIGSTSGGILVGGYSETTGVFQVATGRQLITEGLTLHNSTAVSAGATANARLISVGVLI